MHGDVERRRDAEAHAFPPDPQHPDLDAIAVTTASRGFRVTTSTSRFPIDEEAHRIGVFLSNELAANHPARVDHNRSAEIGGGAAILDGDESQPEQLLG